MGRLIAAAAVVVTGLSVLWIAGKLPPRNCAAQTTVGTKTPVRGVNLWTLAALSRKPSDAPGPAYAGGAYKGEPGATFDYLESRGIRAIRLPFWWYRIQPTLGGALDPAYREALLAEVGKAKAAGLRVQIDLHDYRRSRDRGAFLFGTTVSQRHFVDIWIRLSKLFKNEPAVASYGLMNEPNGVANSTWESFTRAAVAAIRSNGDRKEIWLGTPDYSGVEDWPQRTPWVADANVVYEGHQYFDSSGTYRSSYSSSIDAPALSRLQGYIDWLARHRVKGAIGEVGWPSSKTDSSWAGWNRLAERWYRKADAAGLPVFYWNATSAYLDTTVAYDNRSSSPSAPGISEANSQARVIEAHSSAPNRRRPRTGYFARPGDGRAGRGHDSTGCA